MIDRNALGIAGKWLSAANNGFNELRETVFQARFLGRVPYAVETSVDPVHTTPFQASFADSVGQGQGAL